MHILSLVKHNIDIYSLLFGNENMDVSRAENCQKLMNFRTSNPKPNLHNIHAHTKFGENPLTLTEVIVRKRKYG